MQEKIDLSLKIEKSLKTIINDWFYQEPLLFSVIISHHLVVNSNISTAFRTGRMNIEFSPEILKDFTPNLMEEALKIEVYRILLGHPYMRLNEKAKKAVLLIASDITINQFFKISKELRSAGIEYLKSQANRFSILEYPLGIKYKDSELERFFLRNLHINPISRNLETVDDLTIEQWYQKILLLIDITSSLGTENAGSTQTFSPEKQSLPNEDITELWEENQEALEEIQQNIQNAQMDESWGGIGGKLQRELKAQNDFSFDYRRALSQFRASIVSASRTLTRMRPSRRYGLKAMGSKYSRKANLLIAVDVSGSITEESFSNFYNAIKNIFFLGIIEKIDVIFFDVDLKNKKAVRITKKISLGEVQGMGGTNFQAPIDFFIDHKSEYDGLIIFTDGEGAVPDCSRVKANILWILDSKYSYEKNRQWINSLNCCKSSYLPF